MGQSVLRDGRAPFGRDGRWPPSPSADRKGVGFRSPNPEWRRRAPAAPPHLPGGGGGGVQCGNATDPGEAGGSPGESSLFFVKGRAALEWVRPERGARALESVAVPAASGELSLALENPGERV
ncbi:hypothetical protein XENTR_v10018688 [Xenopus tropicalis]|nr:hypothetical protein XENTR_v10018688 [Xenopus tropicalis]